MSQGMLDAVPSDEPGCVVDDCEPAVPAPLHDSDDQGLPDHG